MGVMPGMRGSGGLGRCGMLGFDGDGGMFPDYFRVPLGASWKTRLIGRFRKNGKPWNKAKNDHTRLLSVVRIRILVMPIVSHGLETGEDCRWRNFSEESSLGTYCSILWRVRFVEGYAWIRRNHPF